MNKNELDKILSDHKLWLRGEGGVRANLTRADLIGANLAWADLTRADLSMANLTEANLTKANLTRADLTEANLSGANLTRADLTEANLSWADLTKANLSGANLTRADLTEANLSGADLTEANLSGADLTEANIAYCSTFHGVSWDIAEITSMNRLQSLIDPTEFIRYKNYGRCFIEGAEFGRMEWVGLPDGWYCVGVKSPEPLPPTDRLIHRILLWRKGREHFMKCAKRQS